MNCLSKYLVLSTLLVLIMGGASAALLQDLNAWDANGVRHANRGEDFNVIMETPVWSDINSDHNYLLVLHHAGTGTYVDLNVNVFSGTGNAIDANGDGNVYSMVLTTTDGTPCAGQDANVLSFDAGRDINIFNVTVTVPSSGEIDRMVGHEVMVEIWPLVKTAGTARESTCGATKVADGNFIVGPAILVYTPNTSNDVAAIDQNITIFGFGFTPSSALDNNVQISIYDANAERLSSAFLKYQNDMNITKAYASESVSLLGMFHRVHGDLDTNGQVMSSEDAGVWGASGDWNGIKIYPDANGEFDVNLTIPYISNTAGSTIGRTDLNTLRASSAHDGNVNAFGFVIAPKVTLTGSDVNAIVTVGGSPYDLNTAIFSNLITNLQSVANFVVKLGSAVDGVGNLDVKVSSIGDFNLGKTSVADYTSNMDGKSGYVRINSANLPEFADTETDFNITMYNVESASTVSDVLPTIAKDNVVCPASTCSSVTWAPNSSADDGNLSFTVSGFSNYRVTDLNVWVITPNGNEKIRTPRHNADDNYTIHFKLRDFNVQDNNIEAIGDNVMQAIIYYSSASGAKTGQIINDTNLFDTIGIRCNGWKDFCYWGDDGNITGGVNGDVNLANWNDCYFDLNRSDLNSIFGEFVVDVNVMGPFGRDLGIYGETIIDSSDANVFFNPPLIEIIDTNVNSENFVMNFGLPSCETGHCQPDINFVVDFNIYLPGDVNGDQNFTLEDYNIHFYLASVQGAITTGVASDLNNDGNHTTPMFDQNFGLSVGNYWSTNVAFWYSGLDLNCKHPAREGMDYACTMQYDTNNVFESKNYLVATLVYANTRSKSVWIPSADETVGGAVKHVMDVNELWDINSSAYQFTINDNNRPRTQGGSTTATVTRDYTMTLTCDDNTSGVEQCMFKEGANILQSHEGAGTYTYTFTETGSKTVIRTFYGAAMDYAGNASDINVTAVITFDRTGTSPSTQPSGAPVGPGGVPAVTPGTETLVTVEVAGTPSQEEVERTLEEAGYTEEQIAAAASVATATSVAQTVTVDETTSSVGTLSWQTTGRVRVTNNSTRKWRDVKVVVEIPKAVASSASAVSSSFAMKVLKDDPIIEFTIPEINVGQAVDLVYTVAKNISTETAQSIPLGMVTAYTEVAPCEGVTCDAPICQTGACNPVTGLCEYQNKADGTSCGVGKECRAGICVEKAAPLPPVVCGNGICEAGEDSTTCPSDCPPAVPDYTIPIVVGVVILLIIIGGAYYYKNYYKKEKGK